MLKILIIDDDILTRKGIRSLMPWTKHNMEIAGEAANGKEALTFLEKQNVDLALVDLDMPVMDGITFIKTAKQRYPALNYVVLTVHTEFEYIQRILRIGALDYIAKTSFDRENFDQILDRINASIMQKIAPSPEAPFLLWKRRKILYPAIYALVTTESENDEQVTQFWELNGLTNSTAVCEIIAGVWVFIDDRNDFIFPDLFTKTTLLCISDASDMTYAQLGKLLRNYKQEQFFYDYQPIRRINHKRASELQDENCSKNEKELENLKKEWTSLNWIYEKEFFDKIKLDLKTTRLNFQTLYSLLLTIAAAWNTLYGGLSDHILKVPPSFHFWFEVENWLNHITNETAQISTAGSYSVAVIRNIISGKKYIDAHFTDPIKATDVAAEAHMCYGYFSRCFHSIIGMSISDYCIHARITKAEDYLRSTGNSVQQVAFAVGYTDEKYFSRIFKKTTGCSPSTFRKSGRPAGRDNKKEES